MESDLLQEQRRCERPAGEGPRYRYQIGASGYWVECDAPRVCVVYPGGHVELQLGTRLYPSDWTPIGESEER